MFDLQKERVVVARHEEHDGAGRADAAHTNHLDREVAIMKAIEKHADVLGQRFAVKRERVGKSDLVARSFLRTGMEYQRRVCL